MKKLITLTTMGLMLLGGAAFAQDNPPVRDGHPIDRARQFRVPREALDNTEIQECLTTFREASATFKTEMTSLRSSLAGATEARKTEIKASIRQLLKDQSIAQREFRKKVRDILRKLRQDRATDSEG
jgi:phosphoenolpyruvate-protein kinase (PTS system EI component)